MIKSLTVTNYLGESINLSLTDPYQTGFVIEDIDGLGPVKGNINVTNMVTNDGGVYNSSRLDVRNIVITFRLLENPTVEDVRQLSYKYFPIKKPLTLAIETDNRIAECYGYVESNDITVFNTKQDLEKMQISIICPDPYLYAIDEDGKQVTVFYGTTPLFEFPFENDNDSLSTVNVPRLEFGTIENRSENNIPYTGDADTGIILVLKALGTVENITIFNVGTRESMAIDTDKLTELTGEGFVSGDEITICTLRGKKSITLLRGGMETNILNCLDKNTSWFQLSKGDNIFTFVAQSGGDSVQFKIISQIIYEGV